MCYNRLPSEVLGGGQHVLNLHTPSLGRFIVHQKVQQDWRSSRTGNVLVISDLYYLLICPTATIFIVLHTPTRGVHLISDISLFPPLHL